MATVNFEHAGKISKFQKKNKPYYFKKKKQPLVLVFDEKEREDFLTGFRKRKQQRKKQAQEKLEEDIKAEKSRIKKEAKNAVKKLVVSFRDIPQLGEIREDANIVDMGTHEVQITELDPDKLARENNWIGPNHGPREAPADLVEKESSEEDEGEEQEIIGMETTTKTIKKPQETDNILKTFKTSKDIKKYVKKLSTKNIQKSKAFQKKRDVEARINKKKKLREEMKKEKDYRPRKKRARRNARNNNS